MLKHNKKRNSYIIYEQLLSLASRLSLAKQKDEVKYVVSIISEAYHKDTLLYKEKKLFESVIKAEQLNKEEAEAVIAEALSESAQIDQKKIDKEKENLVKKICKEITSEVFNIPVKNYKTLASVQILLNESRSGNKVFTTPNERVKIKTLLTERMCRQKPKEIDEPIDNLTYDILINKYNKKYSKLMTEDQRQLLGAWINYSVDKDAKKVQQVISEKVDVVKKSLFNLLQNKTVKNSEEYKMISEAYDKIRNAKSDFVKNDEDLYLLMKYFDLKEDLEAVANEQ